MTHVELDIWVLPCTFKLARTVIAKFLNFNCLSCLFSFGRALVHYDVSVFCQDENCAICWTICLFSNSISSLLRLSTTLVVNLLLITVRERRSAERKWTDLSTQCVAIHSDCLVCEATREAYAGTSSSMSSFHTNRYPCLCSSMSFIFYL